MKNNIVVFDLDGTLSLVGDRLKYVKGEKKDYDAFYERVMEDTVNFPIRDIFWALRRMGKTIVIVTGRREAVREQTLRWLSINMMYIESRDLYMRPHNNIRKVMEIKPELIADFADNIEMIFEDKKKMCDKWRELGYTCLQVAEGNF